MNKITGNDLASTTSHFTGNEFNDKYCCIISATNYPWQYFLVYLVKHNVEKTRKEIYFDTDAKYHNKHHNDVIWTKYDTVKYVFIEYRSKYRATYYPFLAGAYVLIKEISGILNNSKVIKNLHYRYYY